MNKLCRAGLDVVNKWKAVKPTALEGQIATHSTARNRNRALSFSCDPLLGKLNKVARNLDSAILKFSIQFI